MEDVTNEIFISLFKEACKKCFGFELYTTLSETECRHFSNVILEQTGLVIGGKSLKNYSFYILHAAAGRQEKPSVATLDTLARYVLNAPYSDEIKRKEKEAHFPHWFQYRNAHADIKIVTEQTTTVTNDKPGVAKNGKRATFIITALIATTLAVVYFFRGENDSCFTEDFHRVSGDSLKANGWFLQAEDTPWWNKRNEVSSHLTLYTLKGDSWADSAHTPGIKNLLLRKITSDCFITEVHLDNFVPLHRWQQAGILLLEDTMLTGKSLRLSIAYNDFFGGYTRPKEIIVQAIISGGSSLSNPEEIIHLPLFSPEAGSDSLVANNLRKSALRIEKNGNAFRFLYATGQAENFAFKEILNKNIILHPKYIGIFALSGFVNDTNYIPAHFKYFSLTGTPCKE